MRGASSRAAAGHVVLLGGTGFIGAHLARRLADGGWTVTAVDADVRFGDVAAARADAEARWRRDALLRGDVEVVDLDVRDEGALRDVLAERSPRAIVHLANLPLAAVATERPALADSAILGATRSALAAAGSLPDGPRFVYVSSSMVYGDFTGEPQHEDAPCAPRNRYGALKLEAEHAVLDSSLEEVVVARPSAVYGPGDANVRILRRMLDAGRAGVPLAVDDPQTRLDFTHVDDLADGLALTLDSPQAPGLAFNLTRGVARTLADAAAILGVELVARPEAEPRPRRGALDVSRARRLLGYAPSIDLEDGLTALAVTAAAA